ncbi:CAP domain-containing protein [Kribbella ginsengisoli]|uniref:SCP domain-containing protein n=1 Tax=Kribbella ginsengisoli TaxID=363865 RepID=A0ABP6YRA1_9ACTN
MNEVPNDPFYESNPEPPRSHGRRKQRRGVAGPILGALAVLALLAGAGWYVTRDTTQATSQDQPLTVRSSSDDPMVTPTDDASSPVATPTRTPSATPSKTPSKTPSATPTPTRSSSAPSRQGTRSPKPTKPTPRPTHTATPKPSTKPPTTKPPAPSGGAEAQVLQLTNNERAKNGCGPLRMNSALTKAADLHATDMVVHHFFDHNSQDGRSPFDRMKAAGFKGGAMAENIAVGYKTAAAVVDGWMHSEGHRKNILNCDYTMIGIGYDSGQVKPEWGNGSWVQDFGG